APNTVACDDGNACTTNDRCSNRMCAGVDTSAVDCNDGNVCTDDRCEPVGGCISTPNTAACDDGNACTTNDRCSNRMCAGVDTSAVDCNDGNVCTDDSCNAVSGCVNTFNVAPCDDGVFCNGEDSCAQGSCRVHGGDPCGSQVCVEEGEQCVECVTDGDCPEDVVGDWTRCLYPNEVCVEEGVEGRSVTDIQCVANQCTSTPRTETRPCFQNTDGRPCSASGTCVNGACGEPRLVTIETGGNATLAARFSALCTVTGQSCVVEGNRPRGETLCTIACPTGATVELCCSNGSDPCGGTFAANNPDRWIDDFEVTGFVGPCMAGSGSEAPGIQCAVVVSTGPARAECDFTD
ncbi:MAG: hypothetical protein AAFS10_22970, partial [Myxococcota bacterium]